MHLVWVAIVEDMSIVFATMLQATAKNRLFYPTDFPVAHLHEVSMSNPARCSACGDNHVHNLLLKPATDCHTKIALSGKACSVDMAHVGCLLDLAEPVPPLQVSHEPICMTFTLLSLQSYYHCSHHWLYDPFAGKGSYPSFRKFALEEGLMSDADVNERHLRNRL